MRLCRLPRSHLGWRLWVQRRWYYLGRGIACERPNGLKTIGCVHCLHGHGCLARRTWSQRGTGQSRLRSVGGGDSGVQRRTVGPGQGR